ncbi:cell division protein FtsA [Candidatus Roizmanbacteria bacterium CG_4_9_14_0_2_um_filter_39_13]|uniref:Cell division protein FtsA n=2 Tax=Candidatus Roizmaniibacteriota TaxID=1752723 RepID=A0A2M8EWJ1_9BACT|nr:MAG: cell division protein FtsA [Candidatus Roizmanbacteria bacterium CG_4_10_14_0_2_um_filter_39_12]PJC30233.1 MAG: cell division protein FtsA [Candidatus Roizmanbacteria bacterium CG_4_9_14_0_2_um_filter_39_13]PJE62246.1 MAG: cell division protein FtsA [Candidatus Roizmanbacteria bacterium CG10_big_fil_rev_8_21_14_0_10_39_12]
MVDSLICGIDIGSTKVATIVGISTEESDGMRIIGFNADPSQGVKKGLIVDIDKATASVEQSIEKAERMAGHQIKEAFVTVGGPHISSINSHGIVAVANPQFEVVEDDVLRVIDAARAISLSNTRQIIEVTPREYSVDGQGGINNPIGMSGVRLEVDTHIITASATNLKNIDKVLNDLGVRNMGYIFSGVAAADSVLTDTEKDLGVALVDIGGGKVDICIYVEGALSYSSSIPIGARHISNDVAVGLRVSLDSAEKIKLYLSNNKEKVEEAIKKKDKSFLSPSKIGITEKLPEVTPREIVDGIITPRIEEIYSYIREEIVKSEFEKRIPSGLVITGGGAMTIGMVEEGKRIVRLPIRVGVPERASGLVDEVMNPMYSSTLGLVYYGSKQLFRDDASGKDFNSILKNFSMNDIISKVKKLFKQFLP